MLILIADVIPVLLLPIIIIGLFLGKFKNFLERLRKIRSLSLIYFFINIVLWVPLPIVSVMAYGGAYPCPSEELADLLIRLSLWTPLFSLLCTVISSVAIKIYSKENHIST